MAELLVGGKTEALGGLSHLLIMPEQALQRLNAREIFVRGPCSVTSLGPVFLVAGGVVV